MAISNAFYKASLPDYKRYSDEKIYEAFTQGQCGAFALYLLDENPDFEPAMVNVNDYEVHACCIDKEGKFHDISGAHSWEDYIPIILDLVVHGNVESAEVTYKEITRREFVLRMDGCAGNLPVMDYFYYGLAKYAVEEKRAPIGAHVGELLAEKRRNNFTASQLY
jgi:hypothetical protein